MFRTLYWPLIQDENLRFSLEDPARTPFNCRKVLILRTSLHLGHFRPRKAAEVTVQSFGADTHFLGASGAARLSSAAPRAVLGPQVLWRGRGAAAECFGESNTLYNTRRPKHCCHRPPNLVPRPGAQYGQRHPEPKALMSPEAPPAPLLALSSLLSLYSDHI